MRSPGSELASKRRLTAKAEKRLAWIMEHNTKAKPDCSACHGTGIVVCDHGGDGRFLVEQKCACVTELPWYEINDPGAEPEV
jgi:hypothetical protein